VANTFQLRHDLHLKSPADAVESILSGKIPNKVDPPKALLNVVFGKENTAPIKDKLELKGPATKKTNLDLKLDNFLFGTVNKWRNEEEKKDGAKKKEKESHPMPNKGVQNFLKVVKSENYKKTHPYTAFTQAVQRQEKVKEQEKLALKIKEETAKSNFNFKAGKLQSRPRTQHHANSNREGASPANSTHKSIEFDKMRFIRNVMQKVNGQTSTLSNMHRSKVKKLGEHSTSSEEYVLPEKKQKDSPDEGKVPGAQSIDEVNQIFRDIENTVDKRPSDPKKDSGSGKESPVMETPKWWDIRNWKQSVLERMVNSEWNGEAQTEDRGDKSAHNPTREPTFIKALDGFSNMDSKDDYLEFHKKAKPYGFAGGQLGRPVEFNVQGMAGWTRKETWKRGDPRNGVMYGTGGLKPCFHNCEMDQAGPIENLPSRKDMFRLPLAMGRVAGSLQSAGIVASTPLDTLERALAQKPIAG
jgi:hypothetical protein